MMPRDDLLLVLCKKWGEWAQVFFFQKTKIFPSICLFQQKNPSLIRRNPNLPSQAHTLRPNLRQKHENWKISNPFFGKYKKRNSQKIYTISFQISQPISHWKKELKRNFIVIEIIFLESNVIWKKNN